MKNKKFYMIIFFILMLLLDQRVTYALPIFTKDPPLKKEVPIIMYHLITNNPKYQGTYAISAKEMENDLKYLKDNGYETIVMSDLIRFVNRKRPLPEKPIILTFDDGYSSDYNYLFDLLKKYDMKAVLSIVGKFVDENSNDNDNGKKPYLVWEQIQELHKSKIVEIQNHSYNLHGNNGSGKRQGESVENYQARLREDLAETQEKIKDNTGTSPTTFTYPLGIISNDSVDVLKELGFQASLSCCEGINIIEQDNPDCLFRLKRNNRRSGSSVAEILKKIQK